MSAIMAAMATSSQSVMAKNTFDGIFDNGKFFYTQAYYEPNNAHQYYIEVGVGCNSVPQKWVLTALEESAGFVSSVCTNNDNGCSVPDPYPWNPQNNLDNCLQDVSSKIFYEKSRLNDGKDGAFSDPLPDYYLEGHSVTQ